MDVFIAAHLNAFVCGLADASDQYSSECNVNSFVWIIPDKLNIEPSY